MRAHFGSASMSGKGSLHSRWYSFCRRRRHALDAMTRRRLSGGSHSLFMPSKSPLSVDYPKPTCSFTFTAKSAKKVVVLAPVCASSAEYIIDAAQSGRDRDARVGRRAVDGRQALPHILPGRSHRGRRGARERRLVGGPARWEARLVPVILLHDRRTGRRGQSDRRVGQHPDGAGVCGPTDTTRPHAIGG